MRVKITPEIEERIAAAEKFWKEWVKAVEVKKLRTPEPPLKRWIKEHTNSGILIKRYPNVCDHLEPSLLFILDRFFREEEGLPCEGDVRHFAQDLIGVIAIYMLNGEHLPPEATKRIGRALLSAYELEATADSEDPFKAFNDKLLSELKLISHKVGRLPVRYSLAPIYLEVYKFGWLPWQRERWEGYMKKAYGIKSETAKNILKKEIKKIKRFLEVKEEREKIEELLEIMDCVQKRKKELFELKEEVSKGEKEFLELRKEREKIEELLKLGKETDGMKELLELKEKAETEKFIEVRRLDIEAERRIKELLLIKEEIRRRANELPV